ncbi:ATP-binding domain-containing protein [Blastococcus xanthinilyticus]|uniref:DNA helicase IV n=1 Tax=Blastococcus xanthinilyticus TaxID=1564164 RepID=A0A5S5CPL4_9ACTN|nr:ATP-binding domain-containing protein [Blastococcus xanthinilyticus]TYP82915.1 DNA helicase IV [Blastococcus xanthinilyticus]
MSTVRPAEPHDDGIAAEQIYVTGLHQRLDEVRARTVTRLAEALATVPHNPQAIGEREAAVELHAQRIVALDAAESGLCFGRLDRHDGDRPRYVGRIGLGAEDGREEPLLVDWRAPAAQPFYTATPLHDQGVRRRRHIRTRGRTVVSVTDETLDLDDPDLAQRSGLAGESVLLAALNATRTGRMSDIVRTIQAEQDRIIRADHRGVLVVQGGPGTGKTAVALHRAAYLLYTHRERLARSGLLIVGPSPTFLTYIADVLPSLGETGVVLADLGSLRPGLTAHAPERPEVAEVKGRATMVAVVAAAVRGRQAVLDQPATLTIDGTPVRFTKADAARARSRARTVSRLHNEARPAFARAVVDLVAQKYTDVLGQNVLGGANLLGSGDRAALRQEVAAEPAVHALVDRLWPRLTAERLLRDLFASPQRLAAATRGWSDADRALLARPTAAPWTPADIPLLEEADELLGVDDSAQRSAARRERDRRLRDAQETLDLLHGSRSTDWETEDESEELSAGDLLDAEGLADRQEERDTRSTAQRAAADRTWTYGHVIVDEAQELSAMAWRVLLRRCPTRSMTLVGDVAQTGSAAGASSWAEVLEPALGPRDRQGWRLVELTVNYRTPAEIMEVAAEVLAAGGADASAAESVRSTGERPWARQVAEEQVADAVAADAAGLDAAEGTLAVIVPRSRLTAVTEAVRARVPSATADGDLTAGPVVLTPEASKGLEFDSVLVADPVGILTEGVRGHNDLYVALTRATQRLGVVHPGGLPPELKGLDPR